MSAYTLPVDRTSNLLGTLMAKVMAIESTLENMKNQKKQGQCNDMSDKKDIKHHDDADMMDDIKTQTHVNTENIQKIMERIETLESTMMGLRASMVDIKRDIQFKSDNPKKEAFVLKSDIQAIQDACQKSTHALVEMDVKMKKEKVMMETSITRNIENALLCIVKQCVSSELINLQHQMQDSRQNECDIGVHNHRVNDIDANHENHENHENHDNHDNNDNQVNEIHFNESQGDTMGNNYVNNITSAIPDLSEITFCMGENKEKKKRSYVRKSAMNLVTGSS